MEEPPRTWRFPKEENIKPHALPAAAVLAGASAFPVAAQSAAPFMQAELRYSHCGIGDSLLVEGNLGASLCINTSGDIPEIHTVTGDADYSRPNIAMGPNPVSGRCCWPGWRWWQEQFATGATNAATPMPFQPRST